MPDDARAGSGQISRLIKCPQPVSRRTTDIRHADVVNVLKMVNHVIPCPRWNTIALNAREVSEKMLGSYDDQGSGVHPDA
jgi:hypothetical protein